MYDKLLWSPPHSQRLGRLLVFLALRTVPRLLFRQLLRLGKIVKGILKPQAFGVLLSGLWDKGKVNLTAKRSRWPRPFHAIVCDPSPLRCATNLRLAPFHAVVQRSRKLGQR